MTVLDYMTQPTDFGTMRAHGVVGAVVYVAPVSWNYPKAITLTQRQAAQSAGFALAFNFEQGTSDYLQGNARGISHGAAIERAMTELQLPATQPCYLSIDTEVPAANYGIAEQYFRGAQSQTTHPLDFYGENALGEHLVALGLVRRIWMSESGSFPGNAAPTAHTVLQQHYGQQVAGLPGAYDVNTIIKPDWGQYPRPVTPTPTPTLTEEPMLFKPAAGDKALNYFSGAKVDIGAMHIGVTGDCTCTPDPSTFTIPGPWMGAIGPGDDPKLQPGEFVVVGAGKHEFKFTIT